MATLTEQAQDPPKSSDGLRRIHAQLTEKYGPVIGGIGMFHMPHIYSLPPATWHLQTIADYETGLHCAVAGWRGGAKSKLAQLFQVKQAMTLQVKVTTHTMLSPKLMRHHGGDLRRELDTNKTLQARFEITAGETQTDEFFQIKLGKRHKTQVTFMWGTREGLDRGLHPNLALVDDVDDKDDTPYMMQKMYDKIHSSLMGGFEKYEGVKPQLLMVGNYTGEWCSMVQFGKYDAISNPEQWIVRAYPALEDGRTIELTGVAMNTSTWPERMSTQELLAKRREMNVQRAFWFEMEYQNMLVSAENRIWTEDMFKRTWHTLPDKYEATYGVYIDSSQSQGETGDETAITTWGRIMDGTRKNEYPFVDARVAHLSPDEIADEVIRQYVGNGSARNPQCTRCGLESKSKSSTGEDPLATLIKFKARQENVNINIRQLVPSQDKRGRSLRAAPVGRAGNITVPVEMSPDQKKCVQQMVMFDGKKIQNLAAVDDGHDSCVWAVIDLEGLKEPDEVRHDRPIKMRNKLRPVG